MSVLLTFVNQDANPKLAEVALVNRLDADLIMAWYGSYYAGDDYEVFIDGERVPIDQNGERLSVLIDGEHVSHKATPLFLKDAS